MAEDAAALVTSELDLLPAVYAPKAALAERVLRSGLTRLALTPVPREDSRRLRTPF
jgi:hypothetical protein